MLLLQSYKISPNKPDTYIRNVIGLIKVTDGDTYRFLVDQGAHTFTAMDIRVRFIDTAEIPTPEGIRIRDAILTYLQSAAWVSTQTFRTRTDQEKKTLGRWEGDVWVNGINILDRLREIIAPEVMAQMRQSYIRRVA